MGRNRAIRAATVNIMDSRAISIHPSIYLSTYVFIHLSICNLKDGHRILHGNLRVGPTRVLIWDPCPFGLPSHIEGPNRPHTHKGLTFWLQGPNWPCLSKTPHIYIYIYILHYIYIYIYICKPWFLSSGNHHDYSHVIPSRSHMASPKAIIQTLVHINLQLLQ